MKRDKQEDVKALQDTLYVIGGKWKLPILQSICSGAKRFREIERSVPGITTRMLSKELKELEINKLITRTVYDDTPVLIEYGYTEYSLTLIPVIKSMIHWGITHKNAIKAK